jgi:uncharacterized sulfatase
MDRAPNVVWLNVDSVRSDRTTMDGYHRQTTPEMASIAARERGQAFTDCIAHAMWSLPSDASILTGTHPSYHGTGLWNEVLPSEIPTVPERFSELGYQTAAVSQNAYCSESTGLDRGFDQFESVNKSNLLQSAGPRILLKFLTHLRSHSAGFTLSSGRHRSDYLALEVARRRLSALDESEDPFFMFVHTLGAHLPYVPPLSFRGEFTNDLDIGAEEAVDVAHELSSDHHAAIARGCSFTERERAALNATYDALVRSVDRYVGSLFEYVQRLDGPTVFVVTGDHGDLLGEHGVLGHKLSLHDGLVRVPMVVHGLPGLTAVDSDTLVQHADVMAALLAAAGAPASARADLVGRDPREETREYALSQRGSDTYEKTVETVREHEPSADLDRFHPGLVHAVRSDDFKLVQSERGAELYRLPDEETDVLDANPSVASGHRSFLERERPEESPRSGRQREMSQATKDRLADLGYVQD